MSYLNKGNKEKLNFSDVFDNENEKSYNIAEIGINHNGDIRLAKELILASSQIGFDCVKFQKRVPELCVPENKRDNLRTTPWGEMTYFDYKKRIEFSKSDYDEIDNYCKKLKIEWTASAWDIDSVDFITNYNIPFLKVPSDKCSDENFIKYLKKVKIPLVISTGGTDLNKISDISGVIKIPPVDSYSIEKKYLQTIRKK